MTKTDQEPSSTLPTNQESPEQAQAPATESRVKRFSLRLLRWILGLFIILGLGFLIALFTLYIPNQKALHLSQSKLVEANLNLTKIATQEAEIDELKQKYQDSLKEAQQADLKIDLLNTQLDVANAQFAMTNEQSEIAKSALNQALQTLENLDKFLSPDKLKLIADMRARLTMVLNEYDTNPYAAKSDLDVLATSLKQFAESYFINP